MIRHLKNTDRDNIYNILVDTNNFNDDEIKIAMELIDVYINDEEQNDYEIFVDEYDDGVINGYVCIGPRPNDRHLRPVLDCSESKRAIERNRKQINFSYRELFKR